MSAGNYDAVFLDVNLPDENGRSIMPGLHASPSKPEIIIVTGYACKESAEIALNNGAWAFLEKPVLTAKIELPLRNIVEYRAVQKTQKEVVVLLLRDDIIGNSPVMKRCLNAITMAANSDANVLITGETGTGKDLVAQAIHKNSARKDKPFVVVDCASLPKTLVESHLFGYKKGAFTGAMKSHEGLISKAHTGTLFLDEIGEVPLEIQKTLLRVIEQRRFIPVGDSKEVECDFRVIAATNRNIQEMVQNGMFREDLMFRLEGIRINMEPLNGRSEDIKALAQHYVEKQCEREGKGIKGLSIDFLQSLCKYNWPGNVRELVNAMKSAVASASLEPLLYEKHLPAKMRIALVKNDMDRREQEQAMMSLKNARHKALIEGERQYVRDLVYVTNGDIKKMCEIADVQEKWMRQLLLKYKHINEDDLFVREVAG